MIIVCFQDAAVVPQQYGERWRVVEVEGDWAEEGGDEGR